MFNAWADALEATTLATALRNSVWVYPLVNAAHILGVALLVGAVVPLDLRLLGVWRSAALGPLWLILPRMAAVGLTLAAGFGVLLFISRAGDYIHSGLFISKMVAVAAGALNALVLRSQALKLTNSGQAELPLRLRLGAAFSMAAWVAALVLGRLIGYF
ncbi:MAG TPA: hypothetical protein VFV82_03925 [Candidatus Binatia bacterium]|nr:hypothetical protein [Candidatus Binatia bacterium]